MAQSAGGNQKAGENKECSMNRYLWPGAPPVDCRKMPTGGGSFATRRRPYKPSLPEKKRFPHLGKADYGYKDCTYQTNQLPSVP